MKKKINTCLLLFVLAVSTLLLAHSGNGAPEPTPEPEPPIVDGFKSYPGKLTEGSPVLHSFCQIRTAPRDCWVLVPENSE